MLISLCAISSTLLSQNTVDCFSGNLASSADLVEALGSLGVFDWRIALADWFGDGVERGESTAGSPPLAQLIDRPPRGQAEEERRPVVDRLPCRGPVGRQESFLVAVQRVGLLAEQTVDCPPDCRAVRLQDVGPVDHKSSPRPSRNPVARPVRRYKPLPQCLPEAPRTFARLSIVSAEFRSERHGRLIPSPESQKRPFSGPCSLIQGAAKWGHICQAIRSLRNLGKNSFTFNFAKFGVIPIFPR